MDMKGKVCLVTGATSGIGYEAALELARRGASATVVARDRARGEDARDRLRADSGNPDVELLLCDLAVLDSVRSAAAEFAKGHERLDVLINNAGVYHTKREVTKDGLEATFEANHLGHFLLTTLLLDLLRRAAPARIVNVTSGLHFRGRIDFDDLQMKNAYNGGKAYSNSKLANVLFTRELARRLNGSGVTVNCVHPGVIATRLAREMPRLVQWILPLFLTTPKKGARPLVRLAADDDVAQTTGRYFDKLKETPASAQGQDDAAAARLWQVSETLSAPV